MEPAGKTSPAAPPVVAVMVVHQPGEWFDEVLASVAAQDYSNLRSLFLVVGEPGDLPTRIRDTVPNSFVRSVAGNPGFGATANEVLHLVEGDNGFFCFLHDDVALDPSSVRLLVEELYRSNAGIVGPKLVEWDEPTVLQHVGLGVDRQGEIDRLVEPGEVDQEQHDAVRDIFAVPSACMLVRADLFRTVGGFDHAIEYHGDDVDLCWRAHLSGARVVVVPAARVRHRELLAERRPDIQHTAQAARNRMRTVVSLTGARRLLWIVPQLILVTLAEVVAATLMGRFRQAGAAITALGATLLRTPAIITRRRQVAPLRDVPDTEVAGLQVRGSARISSFMRHRGARALDPDATSERRWREAAGSAPVIAWLSVVALFIIGSREVITGGVPLFGEFVRFPESPADMLSSYTSGWSGHGLGSTSAVPTGVALLGLGSIGTLFHMGLLHTIAVLGLVLAGFLGAYRLGSVFPTARARLITLIVYAAVALPSQLLSAGRWNALVVYAATPWTLHIVRRLAGIDTFASVADVDADGTVALAPRRELRLFAQLALLSAVTVAFAPAFLLVLVVMGVVIAVATLIVGSPWRAAGILLLGSLAAAIVAIVANLPWSATLFGSDGWTSIVGPPPATARALGIDQVLQFHLGEGPLTALTILLYLPVLVAPLVSRSWRFAWAVRAALLVATFATIAVLDDRAALPFRMPEPGILLVPVAIGMALSAGSLAAAFEADVLKGSFGWRQPLGVVGAMAVIVGLAPGVVAVASGDWQMPQRTLQSVYTEFPTDPPEGDYRVLWIGDPRVMPVASWTYQPGIAFAITDDGALEIDEHWSGRPSATENAVADALRQMSAGVTLRGGRLLAQYGIRYVVVPVADGFNGTVEDPIPPPAGLIDVLDEQLDLASPLTRPFNYLYYENTAYAPTRATLTAQGAEASALAGEEASAAADLRGSTPFAVGADEYGPADGDLAEGTLHVAVPYDSRWSLTVDGAGVSARRAFGETLAFDVPSGGSASLSYETSATRWLWLLLETVLWLGLAFGASRVRPSRLLAARRRGSALSDTSTLVDLSAPIIEPAPGGAPVPGDVPWADSFDDGGDA